MRALVPHKDFNIYYFWNLSGFWVPLLSLVLFGIFASSVENYFQPMICFYGLFGVLNAFYEFCLPLRSFATDKLNKMS